MHLKVLSAIAAALLLAACASGETSTTGGPSGGGGTSSGNTGGGNTGVSVGDLDPLSQEHIVVNLGDRVFFGYDRYDLSPKARTVIEGWADYANQYSNTTFSIEGHADERGTREYNLALGERRANAAKEYLGALGVSSDRISVVSFGKERPAVLGSSEDSYAQNRRGVLVLN
jgi:peptidoglycan-associated lipoprotein